jgi:hypothetical protein
MPSLLLLSHTLCCRHTVSSIVVVVVPRCSGGVEELQTIVDSLTKNSSLDTEGGGFDTEDGGQFTVWARLPDGAVPAAADSKSADEGEDGSTGGGGEATSGGFPDPLWCAVGYFEYTTPPRPLSATRTSQKSPSSRSLHGTARSTSPGSSPGRRRRSRGSFSFTGTGTGAPAAATAGETAGGAKRATDAHVTVTLLDSASSGDEGAPATLPVIKACGCSDEAAGDAMRTSPSSRDRDGVASRRAAVAQVRARASFPVRHVHWSLLVCSRWRDVAVAVQ